MKQRSRQGQTASEFSEFRKIVVACLGTAYGGLSAGKAHNSLKGPKTNILLNPQSPRQGHPQSATKPQDAETVPEFLCQMIRAAHADAESVAEHLNHLAEHLWAIGCTGKAEVEGYFVLAKRTLASLYGEAAKPHPSPRVLSKLALRYALDARRPIEGDIDRFHVQRLHDGWNVIEYPSLAMRVPAIPLPGRIVKNIFAVRILDDLRAQPPDFYRLMGHLESLLGGVPAATDDLEHGDTTPPPGRQPVIEVDLDTLNVWLDGIPFPVKERQACFVQAVLSAQGGWISSGEIAKLGRAGAIIGRRPDRVFRGLPGLIKDRIEAKGGKGYRLRMA